MGACEVAKGGRKIDYILILVISAIAVCCDMRTYSIPNALTVSGCVSGCIYSVIRYGFKGLGYSVFGILIPIAGLFVLFSMRIIGAGDIKLLAAIGSFVHTDIVWVVIVSFLAASLYGVLIYAWRIFGTVCHRIREMGADDESDNDSENGFGNEGGTVFKGFTRIHLSVSIVFGTLIFILKEMAV